MEQIINNVANLVWSDALVYLALGVGLYFTIVTRGVQFRYLGEMVRLLFEKQQSSAGISPFQAFCMSLSGRIGVGNIAGVATAIAAGGPGAVLWMNIMALLGGASAFIESTLAQVYKEKVDEQYRGGGPWYIERGLKQKGFALFVAVVVCLSYGVLVPGVQADTIVKSFHEAFGWSSYLTAAIILIPLALIIARPFLKAYGYWVQLVLGRPSELVLRERISHLTDTRNDALDFQQDEISRIERDLHDGVQAHLVSMGMTLNEVAALMQEDPERAQQMLSQAQNSSVTALQELRGLVRGIRPPLLADRGLNEAVRSLCTSTSVPTTFTSTLTGRLPEPLETALYFAAAELVTNAVKHANAQKITVGITQGESLIMLEVQDDGTGGIPQDALGSKASGGLEGIRRRLATFDGEMFVSSPAEGPTSVRAIVPYAAPAPQQH